MKVRQFCAALLGAVLLFTVGGVVPAQADVTPTIIGSVTPSTVTFNNAQPITYTITVLASVPLVFLPSAYMRSTGDSYDFLVFDNPSGDEVTWTTTSTVFDFETRGVWTLSDFHGLTDSPGGWVDTAFTPITPITLTVLDPPPPPVVVLPSLPTKAHSAVSFSVSTHKVFTKVKLSARVTRSGLSWDNAKSSLQMYYRGKWQTVSTKRASFTGYVSWSMHPNRTKAAYKKIFRGRTFSFRVVASGTTFTYGSVSKTRRLHFM